MPPKGLSELQRRVLIALAGMQPPWTLTGGGALAGVHLAHRATRDLDLFWHGTDVLGDLHEAATRRLAERAQLLAFRDDLVQRVMRYAAP